MTPTPRDGLILFALCMCVACLGRRAIRTLWPDGLTGEENMDRRLHQLCEAGLLVRQISRLYKDKNDKWQDSTSFGREDLPLVAKVADLAMVWIYENPAGSEK